MGIRFENIRYLKRVEDVNENSVGSFEALLVKCGVKHLFPSFTCLPILRKGFQVKTDGAVKRPERK